jgi:hypothetical protein
MWCRPPVYGSNPLLKRLGYHVVMKPEQILPFRGSAMFSRSIVLCLVLPWLSSALLLASGSETVRIEIKSSWGGLGEPTKGDLVIKGIRGKFSSEDRKVDVKAVEYLLAAIQQPVVDQPSLEACGITERWLLANYTGGLEDYTHEKLKDLSPKQVELFKANFTDVTSAQVAFAELFKGWHTDDYPEMSVTVDVGGKEFGVQSSSQHPFMLPWLGTDQARGGYNCQITQAIVALLPKRFSNKDRLVLNNSFRWELTEQIMRTVEHQWNLLDTEFKVGPEVAPVFAHFTPLKSAISNLSSIYLDGGQAWNAELESNELPSNLIIGVSLRYYKKKLIGADEFLSQLPKYSNLVLSVPWLLNYLRTRSETTIELRYVDGRSLSPKAQESLTEDLRKHGKTELANVVSQQVASSAFIEVNAGSGCWSRAIVLPTKQVLLWHFKCDSTLGFAAKDFDTWEYYGWRSTGTLVGPDGTLVR